jgi:hypothetical protein
MRKTAVLTPYLPKPKVRKEKNLLSSGKETEEDSDAHLADEVRATSPLLLHLFTGVVP